LLIATVVSGVLNYLSNVLGGRMLGPADYGTFTSLASISLILGVVAGVVQTVVTNYVARLRGMGTTADVGTLLVHLLKRLLPWGIGSALVFCLIAKPMTAFLQIPSLGPVIVISTFLIPAAVLPAINGVLRGLQRFRALGKTQVSTAVLRLVAMVGFIGLGLGTTGAVASLPVSSLGASILGIFFLSDVLRQQRKSAVPALSGLLKYSFNAALATICFAVLTNGDVIMVKARFSPTDAGLYSAIATLGKTAFWLSGAAVMLLLPKATQQHARGQPTADLVRKSLLIVGLLCGGVTAIFFLFPSLIVGTFFGEQYLANASLLGTYGLAMTCYSLVNVWMIYCLAVQDERYAYVLLLGVVLLAGAVTLMLSTLVQMVIVVAAIGAVLYLAGEVLFWYSKGM